MGRTDKIKRICVSIKESDLLFVTQRGLKASRVLRQKINELRDYEEGEINYKFANERLQNKIQRTFDILEGNLDKKTFDKIIQKI